MIPLAVTSRSELMLSNDTEARGNFGISYNPRQPLFKIGNRRNESPRAQCAAGFCVKESEPQQVHAKSENHSLLGRLSGGEGGIRTPGTR